MHIRLFTLKKLNVSAVVLLASVAAGCSTCTPPNEDRNTSTTPLASYCDPNYSGCVPIASDVDCADGGGNGPAYVKGPIRVLGKDIYGLDRDGDGVACE